MRVFLRCEAHDALINGSIRNEIRSRRLCTYHPSEIFLHLQNLIVIAVEVEDMPSVASQCMLLRIGSHALAFGWRQY